MRGIKKSNVDIEVWNNGEMIYRATGSNVLKMIAKEINQL